MVFENGYRLLQREARIQLAGPFFRDWGTSVRNIHGWGDGGPAIWNQLAWPGELPAACPLGKRSSNPPISPGVNDSRAEEAPQFDIVNFPKRHPNMETSEHRS